MKNELAKMALLLAETEKLVAERKAIARKYTELAYTALQHGRVNSAVLISKLAKA